MDIIIIENIVLKKNAISRHRVFFFSEEKSIPPPFHSNFGKKHHVPPGKKQNRIYGASGLKQEKLKQNKK